MADSKMFLSPLEMFPIVQENKYLGISRIIVVFLIANICSLYSSNLHHRDNSNESIYHYYTVKPRYNDSIVIIMLPL